MTRIKSSWPIAMQRLARYNDLRATHELIPESVAPRAFDEHGRDAVPLAQRLRAFLKHIDRRAEQLLDAIPPEEAAYYLIWETTHGGWVSMDPNLPGGETMVFTTKCKNATVFGRDIAFQWGRSTLDPWNFKASVHYLPVPWLAVPVGIRPPLPSATSEKETSHV